MVAAAKAAERRSQSGTTRSKSDVRDSRSKELRAGRDRNHDVGPRSKSSIRPNTKMCPHHACNLTDTLSTPATPNLGESKPGWRIRPSWLRRSFTNLWRRRQSNFVSNEHDSPAKFCSYVLSQCCANWEKLLTNFAEFFEDHSSMIFADVSVTLHRYLLLISVCVASSREGAIRFCGHYGKRFPINRN